MARGTGAAAGRSEGRRHTRGSSRGLATLRPRAGSRREDTGMSAYAADAAKAPHPAPLIPLGPLAVEERSETRVAAVRGLLDPANAQLWESLNGARRLL